MTQRPRLPFPVPFGWYSLGRLDELSQAGVVPVRIFGRELVLWRSGDGAGQIFDAWCPHLGAHLGYGGRIEEGCLVCPYHEWSFDTSGHNVSIPYAERPNRKARLRTYPTMTRNGHLLSWFHPNPEVGPLWDIPDVLPESSVECMRLDREVGTAWQEVAENSVDMAHFRSVHGLSRVSSVGELDIDGPFRRTRSSQSFQTARGEFEGQIESNSYGPGVGLVEFTLMGKVTMVTSTTPLETDRVQIRFTMYYKAGDDVAAKIGHAFGAEVARQVDQDIPIWERKRFEGSPALTSTEKPITEFRRWAAQFYASTSIASPSSDALTGGHQ